MRRQTEAGETIMRAQLYSIQGLPTGQVSIMARPRGGDWLLDEITALRWADVDILVSLLTPDEVRELDLEEEAACCRHQEVIYLSFPFRDRSTPPFSDRCAGYMGHPFKKSPSDNDYYAFQVPCLRTDVTSSQRREVLGCPLPPVSA
jgi:hypothetical protein